MMSMNCVSPKELKDCKGRLIDVRSEQEFAAERLAGAECVPLDRLTVQAAEWSRQEPLILMCAAGVRSRDAMNRLAAMGFSNLVMLEGGLKACRAAGLDVISVKKTIPIVRQVMLVAGVMVFLGLLLAHWYSPYFLLVDAFVGLGMVFAGITGICPMACLLEQMPWNRVPGCAPGGCSVG